MDLNFLSQADTVALKFELAKTALESAKSQLEAAKQSYDELLAQADSQGIPKAKLKKLMEDRVQALLESGILDAIDGEPRKASAEPKRARKAAKKTADPSDSDLPEINDPSEDPIDAEMEESDIVGHT